MTRKGKLVNNGQRACNIRWVVVPPVFPAAIISTTAIIPAVTIATLIPANVGVTRGNTTGFTRLMLDLPGITEV